MSHAVMFLDVMASHKPADILAYENEIIKAYETKEILIYPAGNLLVKLANDEVNAKIRMQIYISNTIVFKAV